MELYILGILGVLLHLLKKTYEAIKGKIKIEWVLELLSTSISLIIVILLVYVKEDMKDLFPLTKLTSIFLGYSAQSVFRFIASSVTPKTKL